MPKKKDTLEVEAETLEDEVSDEASEETSEEVSEDTLEVEEETSEVSDTPEAVDFPKIDGSQILSVEKGEYYNIKAANGCTYKLTEEEYKSLRV